MKRLFTVLLFTAMLMPWVSRGQIMPGYTFRTGVDSTKWITLDASATELLGGGQDDEASSVINFGFNFQLGENSYSQFSVSSNGLLTLGSEVAGSHYSVAKFNSSSNFPKILGVGKDIGTGDGGYIKYQVIGQAPARKLVVEYKVGASWHSYDAADVMWQVQLHEDSNKVVLVYAATAPSSTPSTYQIGVGVSINDFLLIDPSSHTTTHYTSASANTTSVWPGINRYYEFVAPIITCPKPSNLAVSDVTHEGATISWTETGSASQWIVDYYATGSIIANIDITSDNSFDITGLSPNTTYQVSVRSYCGVGDTSSSIYTSFTTPCGPYDDSSLPLVESFETWTSSSMDPCYVKGITDESGYYNYPKINTNNYHTGNNSLQFHAINYTQWLVLPSIERPINQLQLSFWLRNAQPYSFPIIVGVVSNDANMSTFDTIGVFETSASQVWEQFTIPLGAYQGNGGRLAFMTPSTMSTSISNNLYLDDVKVELLSGAPVPMDLTARATGSESAVIKWTNTGASEFQIEYDIAGFTIGTGIREGAMGDSLEIFSLLPNTTYDVYVRAYSNGDSSDWVGPVSFLTHCGPYDGDFPYIESFESYTASSSSDATIDHCWHRFNTINPSSNYPSVSSNRGATGSKSILMYGTATGYSTLVLPEFGEDLTNLQLSFKMYRNSSSNDLSPIMVGVMSDRNSISTFDTVAIVSCARNDAWEYFEIPLNGYTGYGTYIAISTLPGVSAYCYIDDIIVSEISDCAAPTNVTTANITTTSANITWDGTSGTLYTVEYGISGFTLGSGTIEYTSTNSIMLYNLAPSSGYDVYIRALCSDTVSVYAPVLTFRTECSEGLELPFIERFDSYGFGSGVKPQCMISASEYSSLYPQVSAEYKSSGNASLYMYSYKSMGASYDPWTYIALPSIENYATELNSIQLSFNQMTTNYGTYYPSTVIVGISSDTNNIKGTFYPIDTVRSTAANVWEEMIITFENYPTDSTGTYIVIVSVPISSSFDSYTNKVYIDDLKVEYLSGCTQPQNIVCTNVTDNSATIEWTDNNTTNTSWEIAYGSEGFDPDYVDFVEGLIAVNNTNGNSVTIQNLVSGTIYEIYIRTTCGSDYSDWKGPITALPGLVKVPATGADSVVGCNLILCDNGGFNGDYTINNNGYMIVYPGSADSLVAVVSGTIETESRWDYLKIYDGEGIEGTLLYHGTGSTTITDTIKSTVGPLTIHFFSDGGTNDAGFMIKTSCLSAPTCPDIANISVSNITGRSAYLSWEYTQGRRDIPSSFILEIVDSIGNTNTVTATATNYFLSGLNPQTTYTVRVRPICNTAEGAADSISFTTSCLTGGDVEISGTTEATSFKLPVNTYYEYSYTQQLVSAGEMRGAATLQGIKFEYTHSTPLSNKTNVAIYIGHTSTETFTSTTWEPITNAQLVYRGSLSCTQGWNEFTFSTPFNYNGTDNLVITVIDSSGAYIGIDYKFKAHYAQAKSLIYYQDYGMLTPPPADMEIHDYRANMIFVSDCGTNNACVAPNVMITDIATYHVDIAWVAGNTETAWNLEYRAVGDSVWTIAASNISTTTYSFTNLLPNTEYQFKVVALCGNETASAMVSAITLCGEIATYPFFENFDTWNDIDDCWTAATNGSTGVSVNSSYSLSPSKSIRMYSGDSYYSYLTLPKFSLAVDTLVLEMGVYKPNNSSTHELLVGVMTDPTNYNTFTQVAEVIPANSGWNNVTVSFGSYTGNDGYITIVSPYGVSSNPYIDNVEVYPISSCPRPTNVTFFNIQAMQADMSYSGNGPAFEIAFGSAGFSLDAVGTYQTIQVTDTFATLVNLMPLTRYDVYVRAICSSTESSYWSYVESFATPCVSQAIPYTENFDSYTTDIATGYTAPSTYPNHTLPDCWTITGISEVISRLPQAFLSSYTGYATTGNCLFLKSSSTTPIHSVLPKFDVDIESLMIKFAYRYETYYSSNGTLALGVMTNPNDPTTFITLESYPITTALTNIEHYFNFDTVRGTNYYIAFRYTGLSDDYYLSIDDVNVDYAPTCLQPRNLVASNASQTTVDLTWEDVNNAGNYTVEYRKVYDTVWSAVHGITNAFTTVTNLSPSCNYEFRVKAVCSAGDSSDYSNTATASTLCGPVQLPFSETFTAGGFPYNCWERLTGIAFSTTDPTPSSLGFARHISSNTNGLEGPHARINIYGTTVKHWLVTPEIDLSNVAAAKLTFDLALTSFNSNDTINASQSTYDDKFMVIVSTDSGYTWRQENATIWSDDTVNAGDYSFRGIYASGQQINIDLSQYSGDIIRIAFYAESTVEGGDNDLHIDNILVSLGSTCPIPAMTVTSDAATATLTWTANATDFEIEYKEVSATAWSQAIAVSNVTSYTIMGLVPETEYMVRIRTVCGEGEYSGWKTVTFTTDEYVCLAPMNVTATNISMTGATITWIDPNANQTSWNVEYGYGENTQIITTTTTTIELTDLYAGMTYNVRVQSNCNDSVSSDWSDYCIFTTTACEGVSNLTADNITSTSATIVWTAPVGQTKWEITYGMQGVDEEHGTKVVVDNNPTYTIEGLEDDMVYDVYVRAICQEGIYSAWSTKLQFRTRPVSINTAANDNVNVTIYPNPANTEATIAVEGINGKVEFIVADMNGRMVVTETINCEGQLVKTIDVSNLAKGAYFVHIYNENFNATRKLIVK